MQQIRSRFNLGSCLRRLCRRLSSRLRLTGETVSLGVSSHFCFPLFYTRECSHCVLGSGRFQKAGDLCSALYLNASCVDTDRALAAALLHTLLLLLLRSRRGIRRERVFRDHADFLAQDDEWLATSGLQKLFS